MKRTLLYSFITAILLVLLFGVQAMAQETYILPENSGTVTMAEILSANPSLKGKHIYGDFIIENGIISDNKYGGGDNNNPYFSDANNNTHKNDNPDITVTRTPKIGLTFKKERGRIDSLVIYEAVEYTNNSGNNDWKKGPNTFVLRYKDEGIISNDNDVIDSLQNDNNELKENPNSNSSKSWAWLVCGFLVGVVLSYILMGMIAVFNRKTTTDEKGQVQIPENQPTSGEKSLNIGEVEQVVKQIVENHSSELYTKLSKKIDEKFVNLGTERKVQNNTTPIISTQTRHLKETRTIQREATEEFCGYAQLPQNGEFSLTITQNPARTAFIIGKRGSDYLVGLIEDEQTLSQLVQPLSDLKANGSNIVDFPEGELQGAQKIVCVERGLFKEEYDGRIVAVKPIQIKRG